MTFNDWWQSLTAKERYVIGINNAKFVWDQAQESEREECAKIADMAEPYKSADLIRARGKK